MTVKEIIEVLIAKGHSRKYAETLAPLDYRELNDAPNPERPIYGGQQECSVCRRNFTTVKMRYHYHPCE